MLYNIVVVEKHQLDYQVEANSEAEAKEMVADSEAGDPINDETLDFQIVAISEA